MKNFKLTLSYDGTRYRGWQRQGNTDNTIQGKVEGLLSKLFDTPIEISGAGRTDAGVHAQGQVANFHVDTTMTADELCRRLRHMLPGDIGLMAVEEVPPRFHSRLSAVEKTYCYRIWNSDTPNVFLARYTHQVPGPLDVDAMEQAAQQFVGTHDFLGFCSNKHFKKSSVRTIHSFRVERVGDEVRLTVTGDGFLYNMVRIMAGTLLEVGQGRRDGADIPAMLAEKNRLAAGETAPAKGLCLVEVRYE
jgi:tRNA pseudouridine38-40 synthase